MEQSKLKKIKPIIPQKAAINTLTAYHTFMKKHCKILNQLEIEKLDIRPDDQIRTPNPKSARLMRIFKSVKYAKKLDLNKMLIPYRSLYMPKLLYFAKRMSKVNSVLLMDIKTFEENGKGIYDSWVKQLKRVENIEYFFMFQRFSNIPIGLNQDSFKNSSLFIRHLRSQPRIKDLTICFPLTVQNLAQGYWDFRKYPTGLEKLSLLSAESDQPLNSSLSHLKNLKYLNLNFSDSHTNNDQFIVSFLKLVPPLSSHLQSLSLRLPFNLTPAISSALAEMKALNQLKRLKLNLQVPESSNFVNILESFLECKLLSHFALIVHIESEKQLLPISNFLSKCKSHNLFSLKLRVTCENPFRNSEGIQDIFQQIDNLPQLKNLSLSITSSLTDEQNLLREPKSIFTKIFNKPIRLESFKIQLGSFSLSHQGLMRLIKPLQPLASTLTKLKIDIGVYSPALNEWKTILEFLKSLHNIRSLCLKSVKIRMKSFLKDLTKAAYTMPNLRSLVIGEVQEKVTESFFIETVKEILQKNGLEKFDCQISAKFQQLFFVTRGEFEEISLPEIRKSNPSIRELPRIAIFAYDDAELMINSW